MVQTTIERYTLGQKIGSGGMGDVYRGVDRLTNTPVAIKVLKAELATPEMVQRFMREGEALRQLNHPNIVKLLDAVHDDARHYLIMELVEGGSLDEVLRKTPRQPIDRVLNVALDMADALTRAHRLNIIHRDIKPANVLLANDGMLRLTDFGIARTGNSNITQTGSVLGTLAYIAPEVLTGSQADARSDIWSMGLMLFEMVAGEHPFRVDQHPGGLIQAILDATLPDLEALRPDAPPALVDVIYRMVMKDPAERIPRMRLVGSELEAILANADTKPALPTQKTQFLVRLDPTSRFETSTAEAAAEAEVVRSNLPIQTTPFVGREGELAELETILRDASARLLTIVGPGGMGKTRLSLELADKLRRETNKAIRFEHGVYFIDLAPLASADQIVSTTAEAVGYAFQQDERGSQQQLLDYLHEKKMLLIMDNFEHIIAGRSFVQDVLAGAPSVKIIVTSREKLNLSTETVFILSGMSFPLWETPADALEYGAVKLFMQSARRVQRDFELQTGDLTYVARICRMMQGTPLGILLAASWLEALTPREIIDEISGSLDFLETEMHDLPERQRSLRAVFEYSWNLLNEAERALFARLSLFRGGFTRDAAQQITGANLRTLTLLVNKSLLRRDNISGRYEVHELLRQYAEEKLAHSAERESAGDAFSRYYLGLLAQLAPRLKGYGQLEALDLIDTDFDNIRASWNLAVKAGDAAHIEAAIEGLYLYLTYRNRAMDGEQLFGAGRQAWRADGAAPPALAGKMLVRFPVGKPITQYRRGLEIALRNEDAGEIAFCQRLVGHWVSHSEFNQVDGIPLLEASLHGYRELSDKFYVAQVLDDLGWSHMLKLDQTTQVPIVQESLALRREIGDRIGVGNSLRNLGGGSGGFFDATDHSINHWEEAKRIAYEVKDRLNIAWNASLVAANLIFKAEYERAEHLLDEGYPHAADLNDPVVKGFILLQRGTIVALRDEDYTAAYRYIFEGFPPGSMVDFRMMYASFAMAVVACGLHDFKLMRAYAQAIFNTEPFNQDDFFVPILMPCRVIQLADAGENERAALFLDAYLKNVPVFGGAEFAMQWVKSWGLLSRLRAELERRLGAEAYADALRQSAAITQVDLAREVRAFMSTLIS